MNDGVNNRCEPEVTPRTAEKSPFEVEFFMVRGLGFQCMAYCDQDGKWRKAYYNDELVGAISLME